MTEATHFVVGAAICRCVRRKPLGLALAFVSHLVLDAIPHFEHPRVIGLTDWTPMVAAGWTLTLVAVVAVWWRFRPGSGPESGTHLYRVAGGFAGGLLDQLKMWSGRYGVAWLANREAHWWGPWYRSLAHERPVALALAVAMMLVEIGLLVFAAWLLFRAPRADRPGAPSPD